MLHLMYLRVAVYQRQIRWSHWVLTKHEHTELLGKSEPVSSPLLVAAHGVSTPPASAQSEQLVRKNCYQPVIKLLQDVAPQSVLAEITEL